MISKQTSQALAKGIEVYLAMRRDKKHEDYLKSKPQKKKNVISKGVNIRLAAIVKRLTDKNEAVKLVEKAKKAKNQTALMFQQQKYHNLLELLDADVVDSELSELRAEYLQFISELEAQHKPANWLDEWAIKAKDISFATHVAKLTHSSSKGSSILDTSLSSDKRYLTTNSLSAPEIDTASSNAASLPVADILKVEHEGCSVLDCLKAEHTSLFSEFTDDSEQIVEWVQGLKQAYDSDVKQSYFLSKQVFFPSGDQNYHLLLPLTSSSLAQALHNEHKQYFEDEQTKAREQRRNNKFSTTPVVSYPNKAKLNITGSNHSNASSLNGKRGGKITLLSSQPPSWKSKGTSYCDFDSKALYKTLSYLTKNEIKELKNYLKLLKNKELSDSQPTRAAAITRKVQAISHAFFDEVMIANTNEETNWTKASKLSLPYQLLFEPYRDDEQASAERLTGKWQTVISKDFARWLNKQLDEKQFKLGTIHLELWTKLFSQELRSFMAIQEVSK
ncbi:CRISPR-associated protein Csy1 [Pseudoalteromonas sp. THAF3]|uniref:type I-F CRISPR-associated protein Csy1 n=1 Tax=Pseudoalteromonas sp. THAF3 TaxID=2587843 RepID=UPI0012A8EDFE|nr:type I-F CRISPR-associated protein Csy1 [Pseudoalteromonas sp. THAF3]QFU04426.1 CRISPR-associated protein Csy1 [Pseudoalteromonas sp. THAF3]